MNLEDNMFPRNIKMISKGLDISGLGVVDYYFRSESGIIIVLQYQSYYVTGLPNSLHIIFPQGVFISEGYKGTFISNC